MEKKKDFTYLNRVLSKCILLWRKLNVSLLISFLILFASTVYVLLKTVLQKQTMSFTTYRETNSLCMSSEASLWYFPIFLYCVQLKSAEHHTCTMHVQEPHPIQNLHQWLIQPGDIKVNINMHTSHWYNSNIIVYK